MAQWKRIRLGTMTFRVRSLASISGLRIWSCHELWWQPLAWEPPYAAGAALEDEKEEKKEAILCELRQALALPNLKENKPAHCSPPPAPPPPATIRPRSLCKFLPSFRAPTEALCHFPLIFLY